MGRGKFVGDFKGYGYTIKECGLRIYRICAIRIEIIYGRGTYPFHKLFLNCMQVDI